MATETRKGAFIAIVAYRQHPNTKTFDQEYYTTKHIALAEDFWKPMGLLGWTILKFSKDDPSGIFLETLLRWESEDAWNQAFEAMLGNEELMNDPQNYYPDWPTDVEPMVRYTGYILKSSAENAVV